MSVRIHQLSKNIGLDNKELIDLLKSRGFEVKSASSTIDNISAESLVEEFAAKKTDSEASSSEDSTEPAEEEEVSKAPAKPQIPAGAIVRTKADIEAERKKAEEDAKRKREGSERKPEAPAAKGPPPPPPSKAPPPLPRGGTRPPQASPRQPATSGPISQPSRPPIPGVRPAGGTPAPKVPPPAQGSRPPQPPAQGSRPPQPPAQGSRPPLPPAKQPPRPAAPAAPQTEGESSEATEAPKDLKILHVKPPIVVRDFAGSIGIKPFKLISVLMEMGIFASMNQSIEEEVASRVAENHGFRLEVHHRGEQQGQKAKEPKEEVDESKLLKPRPPVVCILGHVDHGKTTLLDAIRKSAVVKGEAGGITQHIGAYQVTQGDGLITFLDTPGHAAFSRMRERGAGVTDVAVLVVAADDGFMPQTDEALKFAQRAQSALIIAVNKMDAPGANLDRVKTQLQERGITPEDWGGETIVVPVTAIKGEGIDSLLEMIQLQAEIMELKANPKAGAEGVVVESQIEQGRGPTATVIVQRGTLRRGDALICGNESCKVRTMMDDAGKTVKEAPPSTAVRIVGWSDAPPAGEKFSTVKNEREAKRITEERAHEEKMRNAQPEQGPKPTSIEDLFGAIAQQEKKTLAVILRADVHGSMEALETSLMDLPQDQVQLRILQKGVGQITKNDVTLASTSGATVVGFNTKLENGVQGHAKHHEVSIYQHNIIYEIIDIVRDAMAELLDPELRENKLGAAEVRAVFPLGKSQKIAGCMVTEGKIVRDRKARVLRGGEQIAEGNLNSLRRVKDDVKEVRAGFECGMHVSGFDRYEEGDIIECFEIQKIRPSL